VGQPTHQVDADLRSAGVAAGTRAFECETLSGTVLLDGASFDHCRFQKAVLVYTGGDPPRIKDCVFDGVSFEFQGAAARSLALLQAMSSPSSGLKDIFKASFPRLFGH
jgi:hypothetical protein